MIHIIAIISPYRTHCRTQASGTTQADDGDEYLFIRERHGRWTKLVKRLLDWVATSCPAGVTATSTVMLWVWEPLFVVSLVCPVSSSLPIPHPSPSTPCIIWSIPCSLPRFPPTSIPHGHTSLPFPSPPIIIWTLHVCPCSFSCLIYRTVISVHQHPAWESSTLYNHSFSYPSPFKTIVSRILHDIYSQPSFRISFYPSQLIVTQPDLGVNHSAAGYVSAPWSPGGIIWRPEGRSIN